MVKKEWGIAALALVSVSLSTPLTAQQDSTRQAPDSATIAAGKALFEGRGLCFSCHGMKGEGVLGPTLRLDGSKPWLHHDGSVAAIIALIKSGVDDQKSKSGNIMPPRGGSNLNDQQVAQVAAYVWSLHQRPPAK